MIKLHLFSGFSNKMLGITKDTEVGHLYSDTGNTEELKHEAMLLGLKEAYQQSTRITHYDVWGRPLVMAKERYKIVGKEEFAEDLNRLKCNVQG